MSSGEMTALSYSRGPDRPLLELAVCGLTEREANLFPNRVATPVSRSHAGLFVSLLAFAALALLPSENSAFAQFSQDIPHAETHDNLKPAGEFSNGTLALHLEIREAKWFPDDESAPGLPVLAFGEQGKAPSVPGPLIRVTQGTRVHVIVKNRILFPAFVHGLHERPGGERDMLLIPPGGEKDVTFLAGDPGTYFYWAATGYDAPIDGRLTWDTELSGALVVDPPGSHPDDRIMVIGLWYSWLVPFDYDRGFHQIPTINGKSWPHTTDLSYNIGDTIHWRVINASISMHPMHLHGAHFQLDSSGDAEHDTVFPPSERRTEVTENMGEGKTMSITWTPANPGNWIFHCHLVQHFEADLADQVAEVTGASKAVQQAHHAGHETAGAGMAGLAVGVHIKPGIAGAHSTSREPVHKLVMEISRRSSQAQRSSIVVELRDGASTASTAPGSELGPTLVLHRNETTEITVVNHLAESTAIHWHGIALESYYDGVVGFGGDASRVTPAIAPGGSFVARMTPPRAGTYIYHTHWHDVGQLSQGLYGPLIVLEPGEKYDPEHDRVFVASRAGPDLLWDPLLVNGIEHPTLEPLRAGAHYRFRFINITPSDDAVNFALMQGGKPASWTPIAKDGADLPSLFVKPAEAKLRFGSGETYDFTFDPKTAADLELQSSFIMLHTTVPLKVLDATVQ